VWAEQVEEMQTEITALKKHKDETEAELGTLEDELRVLREDKSSWSTRLTELSQEKQDAQDLLQGLRLQFNDLEAKQHASEGTTAELRHMLSSREQAQKRLEKQVANAADTQKYLDQVLKQSDIKDKTLAKYQKVALFQTAQVNFMLGEFEESKMLGIQLERALSLLDIREEELLRLQMEVQSIRNTMASKARGVDESAGAR
jgi:chromosome segregation ATPase